MIWTARSMRWLSFALQRNQYDALSSTTEWCIICHMSAMNDAPMTVAIAAVPLAAAAVLGSCNSACHDISSQADRKAYDEWLTNQYDWEIVNTIFLQTLMRASSVPDTPALYDDPFSTMVSAATICLSHVIRSHPDTICLTFLTVPFIIILF